MSNAVRHRQQMGVVGGALSRAVDFLANCQLGTGAITEPVVDPLAVLTRPESLSQSEMFFAMSGADVWHTVNALAAFRCLGSDNEAAAAFVAARLDQGIGLSHWSARTGLCAETTAAMTLIASNEIRKRLRSVLQRHALAHGRWSTFIVDGPGSYETYVVGPSVTAWVLLALEPSDPLRESGLGYLRDSLGDRPIWGQHPAFYSTPFYPAHVAAQLVPEPRVLDYVLDTQDRSGAWGFGDPPMGSSALPTALAMQTLRAFPRTSRIADSLSRAREWLLGNQSPNGAFLKGSAPEELWYAGSVYTTCAAIFAMVEVV